MDIQKHMSNILAGHELDKYLSVNSIQDGRQNQSKRTERVEEIIA